MTATVHLTAEFRRFTDGIATVEAEGATVQALVADLDQRFPGLGERLRVGSSVVIDGELIANADYEPVADGTDIHFVSQLSGG